ncbi:MAG: hypothetical protein A2Y14_00430 [Verrucomicrobia bacterium GWF2_51_19]|nr:MAG: hypothetical protein A2Y14_00430 [Verrucomicrobia bacterium GWF2_51_19]
MTVLFWHRPGREISELSEKQYNRGLALLREGRKEEALFAFLEVIEKRKQAPESHLEVGCLQLEVYKDPISAIYHFRQYLQNASNNTNKALVEQLVERAKCDFASQLKIHPEKEAVDALDMAELLKQAREENLRLKQRLSVLEATLKKGPAPNEAILSVSRKHQPAIRRQSKQYAIQPGDTLSKISTKVYGSPQRWKDILDANPMQSPNSLVVGQMLKIP